MCTICKCQRFNAISESSSSYYRSSLDNAHDLLFLIRLTTLISREIHVKTRDDVIIAKTAKYEMNGISAIIRNIE